MVGHDTPGRPRVPSRRAFPDRRHLFRQVGLLADGPLHLGTAGAGVRCPACSSSSSASRCATAPIDVSLVGKWIERVPDLTLDGERPTSKALAARLASFWLPDAAGSSTSGPRRAPIARPGRRDGADGPRGPPAGQRRALAQGPAHAGDGCGSGGLRPTAIEEYEDAVLTAFAAGAYRPTERAKALPDVDGHPAVGEPAPADRGAQGDGPGRLAAARAERAARRRRSPRASSSCPTARPTGRATRPSGARRPAPGRGVGKVASAAAYAAQGSPRRPAAGTGPGVAGGPRRGCEAELDELLSASGPRSSSASRPRASTATSRRTPSTTPRARSRASSRAGSRRSRPSSGSRRSSPRPSAGPGSSSGRTSRVDVDGDEVDLPGRRVAPRRTAARAGSPARRRSAPR